MYTVLPKQVLRSGVAFLALGIATPAIGEDGSSVREIVDYASEQNEHPEGEAIFVTARRREESSQDVPIALSVVDSETLENTGNFTLTQIQQLVPSLQVTATNPRNSNVNIRGLGANSAIAVDGLEYGVGFYVDGVYYGRPGQSQFDLIDLQQVEVLRGPQGTLFGKNTTAGALNISTREPSFDPELTVEGSLGDYSYHQIRASASLPVVADKVAVRVSLADTHRNGFLTNTYDGSDAQDYDNFTARGQLLIKPSEDLKIRLIADFSRQKQHHFLTLVDGYFTSYANGDRIPNNIFDRADRTGYTLPSGEAFDRKGTADAPFQANMKSFGISGNADWDLGPATLTSITAYRRWNWYPKNDVDGTSLSINKVLEVWNSQRQFSQELRIASNGTNKVNYVAGLYYFWQIVHGNGRTAYGEDFAEWNLDPATASPSAIALTDLALTNFQADHYSNPQTRSYAAFGQADWHINDALTLTAGLRYTHEDKKGSFKRFQVPSGLDLSGLTPAQLGAIAAIRNNPQFQLNEIGFAAKLSDDAFSGLVTLSYRPAPEVLLYGTYSRGSKSGGLNVTAGGANRPVVDPETVDAFEVGLKSQLLNGKLIFNAAAFLTEIRDYQTTVSEAVPGTTVSTQYLANIPKVRSKGLEADLSFAPSRWIRLTASAAYTDARFVNFSNSPQAPEKTNEGAVQDLSGRRLPGVSKFAYSLAADLAQPVSADLEIYAHADWLHRSSFNSTPTNSIYGTVPGYGILNGRLGLRTDGGVIDVSVWARNLLDKNYYINRAGGSFGLITAMIGEPRTAGATVRIKW